MLLSSKQKNAGSNPVGTAIYKVTMSKDKVKTRPPYKRPGVCDTCGCAVVRSHEEMHNVAIQMKGDLHIDGHTYEQGLLMKVRCAIHTDKYNIPPAEDANGGSGEHKHGKFWRYCVEGATMADCCKKEHAVYRALNGKHNEKPIRYEIFDCIR